MSHGVDTFRKTYAASIFSVQHVVTSQKIGVFSGGIVCALTSSAHAVQGQAAFAATWRTRCLDERVFVLITAGSSSRP